TSRYSDRDSYSERRMSDQYTIFNDSYSEEFGTWWGEETETKNISFVNSFSVSQERLQLVGVRFLGGHFNSITSIEFIAYNTNNENEVFGKSAHRRSSSVSIVQNEEEWVEAYFDNPMPLIED